MKCSNRREANCCMKVIILDRNSDHHELGDVSSFNDLDIEDGSAFGDGHEKGRVNLPHWSFMIRGARWAA